MAKKAAKKAAKKTAKKPAAPKKQYIVTYDVGGQDPVAIFDSLEKAKGFIAAVMRRDDDEACRLSQEFNNSDDSCEDVDVASIKVYEGYLIGKPNVSIEFTK